MKFVFLLTALMVTSWPANATKCHWRETCMTPYGETIRGHFKRWPKGDKYFAKPCKPDGIMFGCRTR